MARHNYFWITRDVWWTSDTMHGFGEYAYKARMALYVQQLREIASASVSQGPGSSPVWELQLRTKAIQQMKRDRSKIVEGNVSDASSWVAETVRKFGLIPVIQAGSEGSMSSGSDGVQHFQYGKERGESRWDVIRRLASSAKGTIKREPSS